MKKSFLALVLSLVFTASLYAADAIDDEAKLLRYPNTSETSVTFNYAGNIYVAPIEGGYASRITNSEGIEQMPRFSPDGKTIAFIGEYDGNPEIYTISKNGGVPFRVTYSMDIPNVADRQGPDKIIMHWSADGKDIIYRSRMESWNVLTGKLYRTAASGYGLPVDIPVPRGGFCHLSKDGNKMAYNRIFREYRTWKRYRGGQADDIWIYDFKTKDLKNITNNPAQDIIPMWAGNKIYYLSDRTNTMNLYCYDLTTEQTRQITNFNDYDVKFPSLGHSHIAFENGGIIYTMSLANEEVKPINIKIIDDYITARPSIINVSNRISTFDVSPDAKRGLFNARGEIFVVPVKDGIAHNITNTSGVHERNAAWSPTGEWIAYNSDKTGENEIYIIKPNGTDETQLTKNTKCYRYGITWSPDGKKLINSDNMRNLSFIDISSKKETIIFTSKTYAVRDAVWSPDSKWIAYSFTDENTSMSVINLYSLEQNKTYKITNDFYSCNNPEFSKDGKYLFFVSDRDFNAVVSEIEWNFAYFNLTRIYGLCLQDTLKSPFLNCIDYDNSNIADSKKENKESSNNKTDEVSNIRIDVDNIIDRIFVLPVKRGEYYGLTAAKDNKLYYIASRDSKRNLYYYDFNNMKEVEVGNYSAFAFTPDCKNVMFRSNRDYYINKSVDKFSTSDGKLDISSLEMNLDRQAEWKQVFTESWRHFKHFFYDKNMHGVDWDQMYKKYSALLPYVSHRSDLTYIIGEMIGELNAGHAYVTGGEMPSVKKVGIGLLGIDLELDNSAKTYRIKKILKGENWNGSLRSPLTEPGLNVKVGDYILEIDGIKLTPEVNPYKYLVNKANKFVTLKISSNSKASNAREIYVKTIAREDDLRYFNWIEERRHIVDSITNGRIAYIHVPDMGVDNGLNWFAKQFYPQTRRDGLIIDDRYNGGGNVSPMIIERLKRELVIAKIGRNSSVVGTNPDAVMTGPIVCLINEQSMSDGDLFPFQFKQLNLGPVIGKRSWGGVVGIYGSLPLLDGSSINKPEVANFGAKSGNWELEGVGMIPDIEVDNHPGKEYEGIDEQLLFAIKKIYELIPTNPKTQIPVVPKYPLKNK